MIDLETHFSLSLYHVYILSVDILYEQAGSKKVVDFIDAQELLQAIPSARKIIRNNINRFLDTEEGIALMKEATSI